MPQFEMAIGGATRGSKRIELIVSRAGEITVERGQLMEKRLNMHENKFTRKRVSSAKILRLESTAYTSLASNSAFEVSKIKLRSTLINWTC